MIKRGLVVILKYGSDDSISGVNVTNTKVNGKYVKHNKQQKSGNI